MMKKSVVVLAFLLSVFFSAAQDGTELPTIIPPAPSVGALMKFEEVPVDYYSGSPGISLPLYSASLDPVLPLNVGLSYSSSGVRVDDLPGWAGTGWALEAGGSISRTVIGRPDDQMLGVYNNGYYTYNSMTATQKEEFLWNANRFKRDTEPDLYQFNFMGKSGRFYIRRNGGSFQVVNLSDSEAIKIQVVHQGTAPFRVMSFTITDDRGYRYFFNDRDFTTSIPVPQSYEPFDQYTSSWHLSRVESPDQRVLCEFFYGQAAEAYYTPASRTYYNLLNLDALHHSCYGDMYQPYPAVDVSRSHVSVQASVLERIHIPGRGELLFSRTSRTQALDMGQYSGYKLNSLVIKNAKDEEVKRYDFTLPAFGPSQKIFLTKLEERYPNTTEVNTYTLSYKSPSILPQYGSLDKDLWGYFNNANNLTLTPSLGANRQTHPSFVSTGVLETIEYPTGGKKRFEFESNTYSHIGNRPLVHTDPDEIPENFIPAFRSWDVASSNVNNNNMVIYFDGHQGVSPLLKAISFNSSFREDLKGYKLLVEPLVPVNPVDPYGMLQYFNIADFALDTTENIFEGRQTYSIEIEDCGSVFSIDQCSRSMVLKGWYNFRLVQADHLAMFPVTYSISLNYRRFSDQQRHTLGGGLRIKRVLFEEAGSVQSSLLYEYRMHDNPSLSSGGITIRPVKRSYVLVRDRVVPASHLIYSCIVSSALFYTAFDDQSSLNVPLSKGSHVGYKNVTVKQLAATQLYPEDNTPLNGETRMVYTSSIDYPNVVQEQAYPYPTVPNFDYKRGLLTQKRVFDKDLRLLSEENYTYAMTEQTTSIGFSMKTKDYCECSLVKGFQSYSGFKSYIISTLSEINNGANGEVLFNNYFNYPHDSEFFQYNMWARCTNSLHYNYLHDNQYVIGWARLSGKVSRRYFYEGAASRMVSQTDTYLYSSFNKQLKETTTTYENNDVVKTTVYYPGDVTTLSSLPGGSLTQAQYDAIHQLKAAQQHRVSEPLQTVTLHNGELQQTIRTLYKNWGQNFIAPQTVMSAKGEAPLEARVHYTRYDEKGNPEEMMQDGGIPMVYIWGYHKTLPIAKIENATWTQVQPYVANLQSLSDTGTEAALISALDNLRTALPNAMVTTMTHKPLVGVSTMTDPRGYRMRYVYDGFNRLKEVRDMDNNLVTEHEYRYRD